MKLKEITYLVLEELRNNNIVDDEDLDLRLIEAWVTIKRNVLLEQRLSSGKRINMNNMQELAVTLEEVVSYDTQSAYPYANLTTQDYTIWQSTTTIPNIIEGRKGPGVYSLMSTDKMKLPFSFVEYNHMKMAGNGRFNSSFIYGSLRDHILYFKPNTYFDTDPNCIISAIFEDPRNVTGFNVDTDNYPCSDDIVEAIKNSIFDKDFRVILNSQSDTENNANSDGIREEV